MDKDERKVLGGKVSVRHSAALMRAAMNLHYANVFTHAAAVDGSKAAVEDRRTGRGRGGGGGGEGRPVGVSRCNRLLSSLPLAGKRPRSTRGCSLRRSRGAEF